MLGLHNNIELVGEADNAQTALELCRQLLPDIILMDLSLPDIDGITATGLIRAECPASQVIILSANTEQRLLNAALDAGAASYVSKSAAVEDLVGTIYQVFNDK